MAVHVVALQPPGEIFQGKSVVCPAAHVNGHGIVDEAVGVHVANAAHGVDEGAPSANVCGKPWAGEGVVLRYPAAIFATAIDHHRPDLLTLADHPDLLPIA